MKEWKCLVTQIGKMELRMLVKLPAKVKGQIGAEAVLVAVTLTKYRG